MKCPECGNELTSEMIEANMCWECGKILDESLLDEQTLEDIYNQAKQHQSEQYLQPNVVDEKMKKLMKTHMVTTGYNFDGYKITSYLNVISAEVVLGTGIFSSLGSQFADLTGTRSGSYERKLESAKENALNELKKQAEFLGGNAIIGIDIDYTTFTSDILGVVANGTAVVIEPEKSTVSNEKYIPVLSYNTKLPFNICNVVLRADDIFQNYSAALEIKSYNDAGKIKAIISDIEFKTIFNENINLKDNIFAVNQKYDDLLYSTDFIKVPCDQLRIDLIQKAFVKVRKVIYYGDETIIDMEDTIEQNQISQIPVNQLEALRQNYGRDVICNTQVNEYSWICYCGMENSRRVIECERCHRKDNSIKKSTSLGDSVLKGNIIDTAISKKTAREIYEYVSSLNMKELEDLEYELKTLVRKESLFDENQKEEAIETIVRML